MVVISSVVVASWVVASVVVSALVVISGWTAVGKDVVVVEAAVVFGVASAMLYLELLGLISVIAMISGKWDDRLIYD